MKMKEITFLNKDYLCEQDLEEHYLQIKKGLYERIEKLKDMNFYILKDNKPYYPTVGERQLTIAEIQDVLENLDQEFNFLLEKYGSRKRV